MESTRTRTQRIFYGALLIVFPALLLTIVPASTYALSPATAKALKKAQAEAASDLRQLQEEFAQNSMSRRQQELSSLAPEPEGQQHAQTTANQEQDSICERRVCATAVNEVY